MARPKRLKNEKRITFRLSEREWKLLDKVAAKKEETVSDLLRKAVKLFLLEK